MLRVELRTARRCRPAALSAVVQDVGRCHRRRGGLRGAGRHGRGASPGDSAIDAEDHFRRAASDANRMSRRNRHRDSEPPGACLMSAELLREAALEGGGAAGGDSAKAAELIARIESVPFSKWHIRPRIIMGTATFFDAFSALSLASATPVLVRLWHLTPADVGYL